MSQRIATARLILRPFEERDRAPFAAMNADAEVMRHFPARLSRAESDQIIDKVEAQRAKAGFSFCAVEERETGRFVGMAGISRVGFQAHFTPAVEVGWRFARDAWGRGLATEAARAAVDAGFRTFGLQEIVAFTVPANVRSRAVMERLGMRYDPAGDFDHPMLPRRHPIRPHVLYRLARADWAATLDRPGTAAP
ncbi:MAG: GNAT family N-acetyltransferase [Pseudomonadota bacterium]